MIALLDGMARSKMGIEAANVVVKRDENALMERKSGLFLPINTLVADVKLLRHRVTRYSHSF